VSAKQKLSSPHTRGSLLLSLLLAVVLFCFPNVSRAGPLEDGARSLARKVASSIHGLPVTFDLHNNSALNAPSLASLSAAFQDELGQRGVKVLPTGGGAAIVLTLSQTLTEYLGVAQTQKGDSSETVIEALGFVEGAPASEPSFGYSLRRELLFAQDSPILDVLLSRDAKQADVLGLQQINHYQLRADRWVLAGTERLPVQQTARRELKGLLFQGVDTWAAYLPGELCRIHAPESKGWVCEKNREPIPVRTLSPDILSTKKVGTWISGAEFGPEANPKLIIIGQDGVARLFEEDADPVASFPGWGSEIASLRSGCGTGWQLLVTGKGDWNEPDKIQAMEIQDRVVRAVSSPIEFPGTVIALHTPRSRSETDGSANESAIAMVHNLQTGQYEAYRLTMPCNN
jgi:hypothetical protein